VCPFSPKRKKAALALFSETLTKISKIQQTKNSKTQKQTPAKPAGKKPVQQPKKSAKKTRSRK
jgi:hypothetical protein